MPESHPSYASLSEPAQTDLQVITHFILCFPEALHLSPHQLLEDVESSIVTLSNRPYRRLLNLFSTLFHRPFQSLHYKMRTLSPNIRLQLLRQWLDDDRVCRAVHDMVGKELPLHRRLGKGIADSAGVRYTWLRGLHGVSTRILADCFVIDRPRDHANMLRARNGRNDMLVANWICAKVNSAEVRVKGVQEAFEKEEAERMERERVEGERKERERAERLTREREARKRREEERARLEEERRRDRLERERRLQKLSVQRMQRARRTRVITYSESSMESEDGSGSGTADGEENSIGSYAWSESSEEVSNVGVAAAGRVRVKGTSERDMRAARRMKLKVDVDGEQFKCGRRRRRASVKAANAIKQYC